MVTFTIMEKNGRTVVPGLYTRWILILLCLLLLSGCSHSKHIATTLTEETKDALSLSRAGVMDEADYVRLSTIKNQIFDGFTPSASDLDWLIDVGNRPGSPAQEGERYTLITMLFYAIRSPRGLSAAQMNEIFAFAKKVALSGGGTEINHSHYAACLLLSKFGKRAIPVLKTLYKDPDPSTAREAAKVVSAINKAYP